jgi:Spa2 homology domain (SHD) of GIT
MNAAPLDSPNNWRRGPGSGSGGGGDAGGLGGGQPTSPFGQPTNSSNYLGGGGGGGPLSERDVSRNNSNYSEIQSPISPSSDFSLSKYDHHHHPPQQQRNLGYPSGNSNDLPNSRSNASLMSQRSSNADGQDNIIIEHYTELHSYVTSNPPIDGSSHAFRKLTLGNANARQSKAREKLHRLSPTQFFELSTDVYDERVRRKKPQGLSPQRVH